MSPTDASPRSSSAIIRTNIGLALHLLSGSGVRYVHHGRDANVGFDCAGLMFVVYRWIGLSIDHIDVPYSPSDGQRRARLGKLLERLLLEFDPTDPADPLDGDVMVLRAEGRHANHFGLYAQGKFWNMYGAGLTAVPWDRAKVHIAHSFRHKTLHRDND